MPGVTLLWIGRVAVIRGEVTFSYNIFAARNDRSRKLKQVVSLLEFDRREPGNENHFLSGTVSLHFSLEVLTPQIPKQS